MAKDRIINLDTPISPRENFRLIYQRKLPLWLPVQGDRKYLAPRIDPDNIARCFCFEAQPLSQEEIDLVSTSGYKDKFGVSWEYVPQVGGSMVRPGDPLLDDVNHWEKIISFPDIEMWDWESSKASNADYSNTDRCLTAIIMNGLFERLISWMGFEGAAMALIDEDQKDAVHRVFDALSDLYNRMIDRYIQTYGIDQVSFHDDWGGQHAPFFSLTTVKEMLVEPLKKIVSHCHKRGIFFDMHSCGKNEALVPAYIEAGCDSWSGQPINNKEMLYQEYGGQIILGVESGLELEADPGWHNGIRTREVTPEEAVAAARNFVKKYCGAHYLQKPILPGMYWGLPPEYTQTLYEESRQVFGNTCG